jgi:hypothetical protein
VSSIMLYLLRIVFAASTYSATTLLPLDPIRPNISPHLSPAFSMSVHPTEIRARYFVDVRSGHNGRCIDFLRKCRGGARAVSTSDRQAPSTRISSPSWNDIGEIMLCSDRKSDQIKVTVLSPLVPFVPGS